MAFQLRRLLESTDLPHVEIRGVPFAARFHLGVLTSVLLAVTDDAGGRELIAATMRELRE